MSMEGREDPALHAFGRWRFDADTGDLFDGADTVRLEPQVARLLAYFLDHQDILIGRDELMAAVWDRRIVSDHAVNRCISILRRTLSPDDKNAYIETVVRRGFIGRFPPPEDDAPPEPSPPARRQPHRVGRLALAAIAAVAVLVTFGAWRMSDESSPSAQGGAPVVAVLPFVSVGLSGDVAFLAHGIHDDLLTQLAQLQSLRVISRTSVAEYRDGDRNIREVGRQLGADAIVEGGVQRVGDQIRINVQLIDTESDVHLWAQQYDRQLTPAHIFDIQSEIARSISAALHSTLSPRDSEQLDLIPTESMAAYRAYHQAMEMRDSETIAAPPYIAALERAVALDPGFVRAWVELAGSLAFLNIRQPDPDVIARLERILDRIRTLAPNSSDYLIAQSYFTYYILKDHDRAFELIRQAQDLRPSDPQVLDLQSWIQRRQGDFDGVIETVRQARLLDPRNPYWTVRLVSNLVVAHRYDEAISEIENAPVDSFELSYLRSVLRVRDHGQPARFLDDLAALQREYGVRVDPFDLWEAHIAARDYDGAASLLASAPVAEGSPDFWTLLDIPDLDLGRVITHRLMAARAGPVPAAADARRLENRGLPGIRGFEPNFYLAMASVMAAAGDRAETERLIRAWLRKAAGDLAELTMLRHHACRALGMAAAVSAAVECLREGIAVPSQVHPFIEPFLPYYDSIRGDAEFVEFVGDIQRG